MRRCSALSAVVLEGFARGPSTDRRKPPDRTRQGLAGVEIGSLEQPLDTPCPYRGEDRYGSVVVGDLDRLAVAHATNRRREVVPKLPYPDLLGHLVTTRYHKVVRENPPDPRGDQPKRPVT